jgi:hypothetical protein
MRNNRKFVHNIGLDIIALLDKQYGNPQMQSCKIWSLQWLRKKDVAVMHAQCMMARKIPSFRYIWAASPLPTAAPSQLPTQVLDKDPRLWW